MDILPQFEQQLKAAFQEKLKCDQLALKYQNKQLEKCGELTVKNAANHGNEGFQSAELDEQALVEDSKQWILPVQQVQLCNNCLNVFLNRKAAYRVVITKTTGTVTGIDAGPREPVYLSCDVHNDPDTLTEFRTLAVRNVTRALLELNDFEVLYQTAPQGESVRRLHVGRNGGSDSPPQLLLCGVVLTNGVTASEYITKRANDMQLIAQHKYGIRVKDQERFQAMIASLGRSASIVDMLESKASSPIDTKNNKNQASKGAAFILYNYARLSVLFKTLSNKQSDGYYPEMPPLTKIDFGLLIEEDEWQLFWVYVAGFPLMLKQALGPRDLSHLSPHLVLSFTSGLVICLSKYYRRVRILTENREHLLPTMFARVYLLKSVYQVLSTLLELLDLEPITQM